MQKSETFTFSLSLLHFLVFLVLEDPFSQFQCQNTWFLPEVNKWWFADRPLIRIILIFGSNSSIIMRITLIFGSSSRRRRRVLLKGYITGCTSESRSTAIFPRTAFSYVHTCAHTCTHCAHVQHKQALPFLTWTHVYTHVHAHKYRHRYTQIHTHTQPLLIYTLCVKSHMLYEIRQIRATMSSSHFPTVLHVLNPFCTFFSHSRIIGAFNPSVWALLAFLWSLHTL